MVDASLVAEPSGADAPLAAEVAQGPAAAGLADRVAALEVAGRELQQGCCSAEGLTLAAALACLLQ